MTTDSHYKNVELNILEQTIPLVKSKIKNRRFVFDDSTTEFEYVYLGNTEESDEKIQELKEIVFETPQPGLRYLNANHCSIKRIVIRNCPNLQTLFLFGNEIEEIRFDGTFPKLELIDLSRNALTRIELPLSEFPALNHLFLFQNKLVDLSGLAGVFVKEDFDFNIAGNETLTAPPVEIVKQGKKQIIEWCKSIKKRLNEVKLLLVGEAKAGKTSLINRLFNDTYIENEPQTDGIIIQPFKFEELKTFSQYKQLHGITAYFWDFGGQEIMTSTHRFFLTKRSLYILLLDARYDDKADVQVREWMERIQFYGGNSQVIVVINKIEENRGFGLNETLLSKQYPQIKRFIKISCKNNENINEIKTTISNYIPEIELFNTQIDERWFPIKNELQKQTKNESYITERDFENICERNLVLAENVQKSLILFLHDLGIVLHFENTSNNFYVLSPLWVTSGVYRIITSDDAAEKKGIVEISDIKKYINNPKVKVKQTRSHYTGKYLEGETDYIIQLMAQFKLCFYINAHKILIPDLLDTSTPIELCNSILQASEKLCLTYQYKFLPNYILHRLIVFMQQDIKDYEVWRTGVVLSGNRCMNAKALIISFEKQIQITITGEHKAKRGYLSIIRFFLDSINEEFKLEPTIVIPLPGVDNSFVKYEILLKMEKAPEKIKIYKDWEHDVEYQISELLEGIEDREIIKSQTTTIINNIYNMGNNNKIIQNVSDCIIDISQISNSINEHEIEQSTSEKQKAEQLLQKIIEQFDKLDVSQQKGLEKLKDDLREELSTGAKLKLTIPFIPGILNYENDLISFPNKGLLNSWKDLWDFYFGK